MTTWLDEEHAADSRCLHPANKVDMRRMKSQTIDASDMQPPGCGIPGDRVNTQRFTRHA
jgi:hypothetical protein